MSDAPLNAGFAVNVTASVGVAASHAYNITAASAVKAAAGRLHKISVIVAGSAAGAAHDCAATGDAAAGNEIAVIPNAVGVYTVDWPCSTGIVIVPGTGQTIAVSYS